MEAFDQFAVLGRMHEGVGNQPALEIDNRRREMSADPPTLGVGTPHVDLMSLSTDLEQYRRPKTHCG